MGFLKNSFSPVRLMKHNSEKRGLLELISELEIIYPKAEDEIARLLTEHNALRLKGQYYANSKEDIVAGVKDILFRLYPKHPVEIIAKPVTLEPVKWKLSYSLLKWIPEKGFIKALDYERWFKSEKK